MGRGYVPNLWGRPEYGNPTLHNSVCAAPIKQALLQTLLPWEARFCSLQLSVGHWLGAGSDSDM